MNDTRTVSNSIDILQTIPWQAEPLEGYKIFKAA